MRTKHLATLSCLAILFILAVSLVQASPVRITTQESIGALKHTIPVSAIVLNSIVADWDSDGNNEIVLLVGRGDPSAPNGYLAAYEFDGSVYAEEFRLHAPTPWPRTLGVGDVNGDGLNDIVFGTGDGDSGGHVYVVSNSEIVWTSEWIGSIRFPTQLCLGDTDGDDTQEIGLAVSWYDRYLTLYDHQGNNHFSQVFRRHQGDGHSCSVGDIDGDDENELVYGMGSWSGSVTAFEFNGVSYAQLWNVNIFYPVRAYVALGDTNGNRVDEIVVTSGEGPDPRTAVMEGADIVWRGGPYGDTPGTRRAPAVGSWFNNGLDQIAFVAAHGTEYLVHLVEYNGTTYQDIGTLERDRSIRTLIRPFIGDADNDGVNELIVPELADGDSSRINTYMAQTPQIPLGRDTLSARTYIDEDCDGFYDHGRDMPMGGVPITLSFPNGASAKQATNGAGWVSVTGFSAADGAQLSVDLPQRYGGQPLWRCPNSRSSIRLTADDFSFGYKFIQFRAGIDSNG